MKNSKHKMISTMAMICLLLSAQISFCQVWLNGNFGGAGDVGYTNFVSPYNITGIGIGTFASNISAALHVNTNLTAANTGFNAGEVFRTDGPAVSSYWRMYSNATERLRLEWDNTNAVSLFQSVNAPLSIRALANQPITFYTGTTNTEKMRITNAGEVGIGTITPRSKFHVHEATSATDVDIRLSNQATGSTAIDGSMITVDDADGDLRITNFEYGTSGSSNIEFYNPLSDGTLNLTMILRPRSTFPARVGIGTNSPGAKLDVFDDFSATHTMGDDIAMRSYKIVTDNNPVNRAIGLYVNAEDGFHTVGIHSTVDNESNLNNLIMMGYYSRTRLTGTSNVSDAYNYYAETDANCRATRKYGYFTTINGTNSTNVYGVFSNVTQLGSNINYAVYASVPSSTCTGGGGQTNCPVAAGYFNGAVGHIGSFNVSDSLFKDSIINLSNTRSILNQLHPKTFTFKNNAYPSMSLPEGVHYGLLAQEVAPVLPTLVKTFARPAVLDSNQNVIYPQVDHLSINYEELIPILIQAVKEQQAQIDSLILALNPFPTPIKKSDIDNQERQHITLSDQQGVILNQNDPLLVRV